METIVKYPVWTSLEIKGLYLIVLSQNIDGTVNVSFDIDKLNPRKIHRYTPDYLNTFYRFFDNIEWQYKFLPIPVV